MAPAARWLIVLTSTGLLTLSSVLLLYHVVSKSRTLSDMTRQWEARMAIFCLADASAILASQLNRLQLLTGYHGVIETVFVVSAVIAFLALVAFFRVFGLFRWRGFGRL